MTAPACRIVSATGPCASVSGMSFGQSSGGGVADMQQPQFDGGARRVEQSCARGRWPGRRECGRRSAISARASLISPLWRSTKPRWPSRRNRIIGVRLTQAPAGWSSRRTNNSGRSGRGSSAPRVRRDDPRNARARPQTRCAPARPGKRRRSRAAPAKSANVLAGVQPPPAYQQIGDGREAVARRAGVVDAANMQQREPARGSSRRARRHGRRRRRCRGRNRSGYRIVGPTRAGRSSGKFVDGRSWAGRARGRLQSPCPANPARSLPRLAFPRGPKCSMR